MKKSGPRASAKPSRDARRQSLIDAAKDCFTAKGYHATTVDDITRSAGVAKGTFYLYFSEKREIYHEVIRSFMQLVKDIGRSIGEASDEPLDFFGRAENAALQLMTIFVDNRELARLAYRESMGIDPALEAIIGDFYRELADVQARNVEIGIEIGFFRAVDPMLTAYAHIGTVERVLMAFANNPDQFPEPQTVVREMLRLAFEGLRKPGGPTPYPVE